MDTFTLQLGSMKHSRRDIRLGSTCYTVHTERLRASSMVARWSAVRWKDGRSVRLIGDAAEEMAELFREGELSTFNLFLEGLFHAQDEWLSHSPGKGRGPYHSR